VEQGWNFGRRAQVHWRWGGLRISATAPVATRTTRESARRRTGTAVASRYRRRKAQEGKKKVLRVLVPLLLRLLSLRF